MPKALTPPPHHPPVIFHPQHQAKPLQPIPKKDGCGRSAGNDTLPRLRARGIQGPGKPSPTHPPKKHAKGSNPPPPTTRCYCPPPTARRVTSIDRNKGRLRQVCRERHASSASSNGNHEPAKKPTKTKDLKPRCPSI